MNPNECRALLGPAFPEVSSSYLTVGNFAAAGNSTATLREFQNPMSAMV